jgi:hypothetical protein
MRMSHNASWLLLLSCLAYLRTWRWRRYDPPKRRWASTGLNCVTFQNTVLFVIKYLRFWTPTKVQCLSIPQLYLRLKFGWILFSKLWCTSHFFYPNFHLDEIKYANEITMLSVCVRICLSPFKRYGSRGYPNTILFSILISVIQSRDIAVGIATGYEMDDRGVGVRVPVV